MLYSRSSIRHRLPALNECPKHSHLSTTGHDIQVGMLLALINLSISSSSIALSPVDVKDDRKAKSVGFDLIYEARDLDLPQNIRDGLTQARSSVDDTKRRLAESKKRITQEVLPLIKKAYWTKAKEALRLQVGTLRFDLNTLAGTKSKADKKAAVAAQKQFLSDIEVVDCAIREKKIDAALRAYDVAASSLDAALANVL